MQPVIQDLIAKRRDRSISIVLGVKEREADRYLPDDVSRKLRKVVLDQFNDLCDLLSDIARSLDSGDVVLNEHYLEKLDAIHEVIVNSNGSR